jgi:hypothetical protein
MTRPDFLPLTRSEYVYALVIVLLLAFMALCVLLLHRDQNEAWLQFRADHQCTARSHTGPVAETIPGQTTWVCDDGNTYVHNDD